MRVFLATSQPGPFNRFEDNLRSEPLLSSLDLKFQEVAMKYHVERVFEATIGAERDAERVSNNKKEWVAPELRKFDILEVTAFNSNNSHPDLGLGSS